jgi:hypothetical protein
MAYVSHSGSNNSSQYDWKVLIFMVLLLVSILIFVAIKFLYPELITGTAPVVSTPVKQSEPAVQANKIDTASQVLSSKPMAEKKTEVATSAPKVTKSTVVDELKNSTPIPVDPVNDMSHDIELKAKSENKTEAQNLLCSKSDRASGLCQ